MQAYYCWWRWGPPPGSRNPFCACRAARVTSYVLCNRKGFVKLFLGLCAQQVYILKHMLSVCVRMIHKGQCLALLMQGFEQEPSPHCTVSPAHSGLCKIKCLNFTHEQAMYSVMESDLLNSVWICMRSCSSAARQLSSNTPVGGGGGTPPATYRRTHLGNDEAHGL